MSDLLNLKITEARTLLAQATTEEGQREAVSLEIEQLNAKLAELNAKRAELSTSAREKRVIAESQLAAAQTLTGGAEVVNLAEKKAAQASKKDKAAAAAASAAAPAKETKSKVKAKGKADGKPAAAPEKAAAKTAKTGKVAKTAAVKTSEKPEKVRVASDDKMPPLHERLRIVIGNDECSIPECIDRLRARDESWVPESKELKAYISLALSTHVKDLFQRVKRGVYRVRAGASTEKPKPIKKAVHAAKTNGAHNPASNGASTDETGNIEENPFSPVAA